MGKQIYKKVFLDDLPRLHYVDKIDWKKCIDKKIHFIYGDIEDYFIIRGHDIKTQTMSLEYNNKIYYIKVNSVLKGKLGGLFKQKNFTYLYDIGDIITDNGRNMTIIDRYKNEKNIRHYKYVCNICGWENGDISEYELKKGVNCSCCSNRTVVRGINDITTTASWMIPYFQGGADEASQYTRCSNKTIVPVCPECKTIYNRGIKINTLYAGRGFSCPSCKDGYSYSEKFMYSVFKQLNLNFIIQFSSKDVSWAKKYRYDFGLLDYNCVVEVNGLQHYEITNFSYKGRSLQEEINNDKIKKLLALNNGFYYYAIDCRKSDKNWIKQSIINSGILHLLKCNENDINWDECDKFAMSNRCKEVCKMKSENPKLTAKDISEITLISHAIVCDYLHKGTQFGWCYYNRNNKKRIQMLKDGSEIGVFDSVKEITKLEQYKDFCETTIQNVCRGHRTSYKGYTFIYV